MSGKTDVDFLAVQSSERYDWIFYNGDKVYGIISKMQQEVWVYIYIYIYLFIFYILV